MVIVAWRTECATLSRWSSRKIYRPVWLQVDNLDKDCIWVKVKRPMTMLYLSIVKLLMLHRLCILSLKIRAHCCQIKEALIAFRSTHIFNYLGQWTTILVDTYWVHISKSFLTDPDGSDATAGINNVIVLQNSFIKCCKKNN